MTRLNAIGVIRYSMTGNGYEQLEVNLVTRGCIRLKA